jgi:amino acid transporter
MSEEQHVPQPSPSNDSDQRPKQKSPALALVLAFLPAAIFLWFSQGPGRNAPQHEVRRHTAMLLGASSVVSFVCCFVSAFMLFARRTALAMGVAVVFLILNFLIAFFLGCIALFKMDP